jgi:hypothetical protein
MSIHAGGAESDWSLGMEGFGMMVTGILVIRILTQ